MKRRKECFTPNVLECALQKALHLPRRYFSLLLAAGLLSLSPVTLAGPFPAALRLENLNGTTGFRIDEVATNSLSDRSVSTAGDINGDGVDDLIIGASGADPNGFQSGASYVVFGTAQGFPADINIASLNGSNGFRLDGAAPDNFSGRSVSAAGDVNGDGVDDLIIGADVAGPNGIADHSGSTYVVFGRNTAQAGNFPPTLPLANLDGTNGFRLDGAAAGDRSGWSVSEAGDVNHDGVDDLIIGAFVADPSDIGLRSGASYVVFGTAQGFPADINLASLDGNNGFRIDGVGSVDHSGTSVSAAGDVNDDGVDDIIIGAHFADPKGSNSGASYVVFGRNTAQGGDFPAALPLANLDGTNGFRLDGAALGDLSGHSVGAAEDLNSDGVDDLIIGAPNADPNGMSNAGSSYVVFGRNTIQAGNFPAALSLSGLDGTNGFRLDGAAAVDLSGY